MQGGTSEQASGNYSLVDKESGMELGIGRSLNSASPFCPLEKQVDAELCGGGQVYQVVWLLGQPACHHFLQTGS